MNIQKYEQELYIYINEFFAFYYASNTAPKIQNAELTFLRAFAYTLKHRRVTIDNLYLTYYSF